MKKFKKQCTNRIYELLIKLQVDRENEEIKRTICHLYGIIDIIKAQGEEEEEDNIAKIILDNTNFLARQKQVLRLIEEFSKIEMPILGEEPTDPNISREDRITLVHDFFKEVLDRHMYEVFSQLLKRRKELVHYFKNPNENKVNREVYLPFYHEAHIFINETSSIDTISSLCHEYMHAIISMINDDFNQSHILAEISSEFAETLVLDYLKRDSLLNAFTSDLLCYTYCEYLSDAKILQIQSELLKKCHFRDEVNFHKFQNTINHLKKQDKFKDMEEFFDTEVLATFSASNYLKYSIGQVMEQILFLAYREDPQKARFILRKLINLNWHRCFKDIRNDLFSLGLEPTEETAKTYKSLIMKPQSSCFKK